MSHNLRHGIAPTNLFTKIFPDLPALSATPDELRLLANLMRDPTLRLPAVDKRNYAGLTYLGQFIDHDLTRERRTVLGNEVIDVNTLINDRTSWFDLDSVYGDNNSLLNAQGLFDFSVNQFGEEDLPRNPDGTAIIGDPRNEENLITAGLHFVLLKFHNKVMQDLQLTNPTMLLPQLISVA
jgi:hypothetical protein